MDLLKSAFLYNMSKCCRKNCLRGSLPLLFNKTGTGKIEKMRGNLLLSHYFERVKEGTMVITGLSD